MKNAGLLLVVLLCITGDASSQHFPLAPGTLWRYRISDVGYPGSTAYMTIRVTGDTLMPDGCHYAVLEPHDVLGGRFVRCDSTVMTYWDTYGATPRKVLDVSVPSGHLDSIQWMGYFTARAGLSYRTKIFGDSTTVRSTSFDGLIMGRISFAEGFGYSQYEFYGDGAALQLWELVGCRIAGIDYGTPDAVTTDAARPGAVVLHQNYPNPFNPSTTIRYTLASSTHVQLIVYNSLGEQVAVLQDGEQSAGVHVREFHATKLPNGVYFYQLKAGGHTDTKTCIVLK